MASILWLNWSGGGNLPPSLGIARVLTARGHDVSFAGRPEMVPRVERAGFRAIELSRAYEQAAQYPNKWSPPAASFLSSPAVGEEIDALLRKERPDLAIVDAMFPVALAQTARSGIPAVVMLHTAFYRMFDRWQDTLAMIVGLRAEAGFGPLPADIEQLWMPLDRVLVTTLKVLDLELREFQHAHKVRHVGPVLESEPHAKAVTLPWPDDDQTPLVLVSFSTMPEQGSVAKFQNAIDALAALPIRGVVTTGDSIDPGALRPAANVAVFATADHDQLLRRASAVITHGGHGTMMRTLSRGLPMVVIPGMAADQPVNARAVQDWGAGIALPSDADAAAMRQAVREVLDSPQPRQRARELSRYFAGVDGAANAADEVEASLAIHQPAAT